MTEKQRRTARRQIIRGFKPFVLTVSEAATNQLLADDAFVYRVVQATSDQLHASHAWTGRMKK